MAQPSEPYIHSAPYFFAKCFILQNRFKGKAMAQLVIASDLICQDLAIAAFWSNSNKKRATKLRLRSNKIMVVI